MKYCLYLYIFKKYLVLNFYFIYLQSNNTQSLANNTNNTNHENQNNLNLNMSAKELRARLALRKKYDPKKDYLDIKKKYDIVQKL